MFDLKSILNRNSFNWNSWVGGWSKVFADVFCTHFLKDSQLEVATALCFSFPLRAFCILGQGVCNPGLTIMVLPPVKGWVMYSKEADYKPGLSPYVDGGSEKSSLCHSGGCCLPCCPEASRRGK